MNEFYSDHIRINLTTIARKIIENDSVLFGASSNSKLTFGTLINRIIENFDDDFDINEDHLTLRGEGTGRLIYLQADVVATLERVRLSNYLKSVPNPTVSKYVKCFLESFARLPFIEQERLILKKEIHCIESAIKNKKALWLKFKGTPKVITPICISPAKEGTFQYLIGIEEGALVSIRLSRIEKIKAMGKADRISENIKNRIDESLSEFGPTFVVEPPVTVKVRFTTQEGLGSYLYSVMHRPMHCAIEDENVFVFNCSETQALYFFFRFAGEAEILEPKSLRDKFRTLYQAGLNNYQ